MVQCYSSSSLYRIPFLLATLLLTSLLATESHQASGISTGKSSEAQSIAPQTHLKLDTTSRLVRLQSPQQAQSNQQSHRQQQQYLIGVSSSSDSQSSQAKNIAERASPRFVGKRDRDAADFRKAAKAAAILVANRGIPRFVGKKRNGRDGNNFNNLGNDILLANRAIPRFVGRSGSGDNGLSGIDSNILLGNRASPRFVGKRYDSYEDSFDVEARGKPFFVGKKESDENMNGKDIDIRGKPRFVGRSANMERGSRGKSPKFFGKKRDASSDDSVQLENENGHKIVKRTAEMLEVSAGYAAPSPSHKEKRRAPKFIGKRGFRYNQRGAPFFIGKRHIRMPSKDSMAPFLSAQEYKETFRRSDPFFIGKREEDYGSPIDDLLNEVKRGAPKFIGKRGPPRFVGRRGAPKFIGRRGAPKFVGKRDFSFNDGFFDSMEEDEYPEFDADVRFGLKRLAPKFVGRRSEYDGDTLLIGDREVEARDYGKLLEALSEYQAIQRINARMQDEKRNWSPRMIGRRNAEEFPSGVFSAGDDEKRKR